MDKYQDRLLADLGPIYYETDLNRMIVEPFNAFSSLTMSLAAILILAFLVRKDFRSYPFLSFVFCPLIFIGGVGSTLYHAFRATPFFLYMDVVPVFLLTILLSLMYWYKIYPKWYFVLIMVFVVILARGIPVQFLKGSTAINVSYLLAGLLIIIPMAVFMVRTNFKDWKYVAFSISALLVALFFRYTDDFESLVLPMGTHWLWHVFSGVGAWFLGGYIYRTSIPDPNKEARKVLKD